MKFPIDYILLGAIPAFLVGLYGGAHAAFWLVRRQIRRHGLAAIADMMEGDDDE